MGEITRFGALTAFAILCSAISSADSIAFSTTQAYAAVGSSQTGATLCLNRTISRASCSALGASGAAVVTNGSGGMATALAGKNGATLTVSSGVIYYFEVEGPSSVSVPMLINGTTTAIGGASHDEYEINSTSTILLEVFANPSLCAFYISQGTSCDPTGAFTLKTTIASDTIYGVIPSAVVTGTNASASIDPVIRIDPSFSLASEFTLVANPGVFTTTPEPSSLWLVALALLGACLMTGRFPRVQRWQWLQPIRCASASVTSFSGL